MKLLKNYGLSIALIALFLFSWAAQGIFQWEEFVSNQKTHNQSIEFQQFIPEFLSATFENWQSEFLQLFTFVILSTYLLHKNSPQSRDGDDHMQNQIDKIEKMLSSKK